MKDQEAVNYLEKKYRGGAAVEHSFEETVQLAIAALQVRRCAVGAALPSARYGSAVLAVNGLVRGESTSVNTGQVTSAPPSDSRGSHFIRCLIRTVLSPTHAGRLHSISCPGCTLAHRSISTCSDGLAAITCTI